MTKSSLIRRAGLPALFLSGAVLGSAITGAAIAGQPHMQNALNSLYTARTELQAATQDKGGYRVHALGYVGQAIAATQAGINYAKTH